MPPTVASQTGRSIWLPPGADRDGGTRQDTKGARPDDPVWQDVVKRFHPAWRTADLKYRWLMDSLVAGDRYINGVYGYERDSYLPIRNLVRHPREYPDPQKIQLGWYAGSAGAFLPTGLSGAETATGLEGMMSPFGPMPGYPGSDPHSTAHDDDYEYRRARTVPPNFVGEAAAIHLGKIYDQEVRREGPDDLKEWWNDVDGRGTSMDDWMRKRVARLFLTFGCLDVLLDHPRVPGGEKVSTRADELRLGLDRCIATFILPQNMVWWRLDAAGRYECCLVREYADPSERYDFDDDGDPVDPDYPEKGPSKKRAKSAKKWRDSFLRWRYWSPTESVLLNHVGDEILERTAHNFGMVPIVRVIHNVDPHADNMGLSEYETVARLQRAYYNLDSELVLSNSLQAHPYLSGAEDFCKADNTLSVGPGYILPKKKNPENGQYEGWEFVSPPKDPAESLRKDKQDIRDAVDRDACLAKPAGAVKGSTTAQSGVSKEMDHHTGHKKLRPIAQSLAEFERVVSEYALMVLRNTPVAKFDKAVRESIKVAYPSNFQLGNASEMTDTLLKFQQALAQAGDAPEAEGEILMSIERQLLTDLPDEEYEALEGEIKLILMAKARVKEQLRELAPGITDNSNAEGDGSTESAAEQDPLGQNPMTAVSGFSTMAV